MDVPIFQNRSKSFEEITLVNDWLQSKNLLDQSHRDFALTDRTRRLQIETNDEANGPAVKMFVTVVVLPLPPWRNRWLASDQAIYSWLKDTDRRYLPFPNSTMFPSEPKPMHGGVVMEESNHRTSEGTRRYVAIERTGILEMGLGDNVCINRQNEKAFFFTTLIGNIWHFLGFACDFHRHVNQEEPFILLVNMRETKGALLAGLANGWREPWGPSDWKPRCREAHVQIRHDELNPILDANSIERVVTEIAFEIEAAWGQGGKPSFFPRCFSSNSDGSKGAFDLSVVRI